MSIDEAIKQVKSVLSTVPYFSNVDAKLIETIAQQMKVQQYDTGQVVFLDGEQDVALYIVHSGWLKAVKTSLDGREQVLRFIGAGEVFNEVGVFINSANTATVIALEPTTVRVIQQSAILKLLDQHPEIGRVIIQRMAERIQQLTDMIEDLSLRTIEARLARYLIEQSTAEYLQRPRWATQAEMANRLGTVPDVLNRALRNFAKDNLIHVERHQIKILDYKGLEAKAGLDK